MKLSNQHYKNIPQNPVYLEYDRSDDEKAANAKLLNEQLLKVQIKRYFTGGCVGIIIGIIIGINI